LTLGASLGVGLITACSLGYQSQYEGDVRFEHCYRLDEERQVSIAEKRQCWHDWVQRNTYGQTRDRVEYALGRERALGQAQALGEPTAPPGVVTPKVGNASPQPTNAFAPPPQTMARDAGPDVDRPATVAAFAATPTPATASGLTTAPGASCGGACGKAWVQCGEHCRGNGCQPGCDDRYRNCMRSCF